MFGLTEILKGLTRAELNKLETFLKSPYCNSSNRTSTLFKELKKFYPDFTNKNLTNEFLGNKIFSDKVYKDSTFRKIVSDLQTQIENFISFEELRKSDYDNRILLLKGLVARKCERSFNSQVNQMDKILIRDGYEGRNYYIRSRIDLYSYNHGVMNRTEKTPKDIKNNTAKLIDYIVSLLSYAITEIINSHLKLLVMKTKLKVGNDNAGVEKLINTLNLPELVQILKKLHKDHFIIELYHNLFLTFKTSVTSSSISLTGHLSQRTSRD